MSDFEYCSQGKEVSKQSPVTYVEVSKTLKKMPQLPLNNFSLLYELKKKKSTWDCCGGVNESVRETDIVLIWAAQSPHPQDILQTFIANRNDPRTCPDLSEAVGSMTSCHTPPSQFCTGFGNKKCSGLHIHPARHPFFRLCWCTCVCVCVYVSRPSSVPLTTLHCHHHTQLPPASLSFSRPPPSYSWCDLYSGS